LKQAVRRNMERFPEDFMFELTKDEWNIIRSQLVMFKNGQGKFPKYLPFVGLPIPEKFLKYILK